LCTVALDRSEITGYPWVVARERNWILGVEKGRGRIHACEVRVVWEGNMLGLELGAS
jgi:hypothetical protein